MLRALLLLFIVVPLVELYLLTLISRATNIWFAIGLTLFTGVLGSVLAKREGLKVWRRWQQALNQMQVPEEGVIGGILVLLGGALLIAPGVLTDLTGLFLLIPVTRRWLTLRIRRSVEARFAVTGTRWSPLGSAAGGDFGGYRAPRDAVDTTGTPLDP